MMSLSSLATRLRKNQTNAERMLWSRLRAKQIGYKFRRQHPVGLYIVDFVCLEKKLVVELDGGQHMQFAYKDEVRDTWLMKEGYKVLHFWNHEVPEHLTVFPSPGDGGRGEGRGLSEVWSLNIKGKLSPSPASPPFKQGGEYVDGERS